MQTEIEITDETDEKVVAFVNRTNNYQPNIITRSKQSYTALEKRLFVYIINQINHQEDYIENQNLKFVLPINEVSKGIPHRELKRVCLTIMEKKIYILNEKDQFDAIVPFPRVQYNIDQSGTIEITMFSDIIPFFIELGKQYTRYSLEIMLSLSSKYSQRMYELLRLSHGRKSYEFTENLDNFKQLLDATKYKNYKDFRLNVLEPARKELYEKAGISFNYDTNGKQRNIDTLRFKIDCWKDSATDDVSQELANYIASKPQTQYNGVRNLLEQHYTFKKDKIDIILNDKVLREEFVRVNALIEVGLVEIKKTKTSYMASCLGFNKNPLLK
jgi:plasmid replication initiation protein